MGIDPGYDRIGWGVGTIEKGHLTVQAYGCIETDKKSPRLQRYQQLEVALSELVSTYSPTEAGVETLFFSKNQTTAIHVAEARGIILSTLLRNKVSVSEYNPMEIKLSVTGNGKADKKAVEKMVRLQLHLPPTTGKQLDDALDALAILLTHAASRALTKRV